MNRKQITITLAGLGIMAIAAVGCASQAVSADDELNIDNTPVIGAPAEPNTDPNDSVEHLNPSTPDETGIFPTKDPNAEPGDVIDYPILDPGIGNGEMPIPVEPDNGIGDGADPIPVHPIESPTLHGDPTYEQWLASHAMTSPIQLPEIDEDLRPLPVNPIEPPPPVNPPMIEVEEVVLPLLCMSTMAVQLPIEFHFGQDATPTGFDGINSATCMFPEKIEKITVVLTGVDGGPSHAESWGLPEVSSSVSFPLPADWFSMATRAWLGAGEYHREMFATGVSGATYDLVAQAGALDTVTILAD